MWKIIYNSEPFASKVRFDLICEYFGKHFINKAYVCIRGSFIRFPRHLVTAATDKLLETLLLVYWMTVRLLLDYSRLLLDYCWIKM